MKCIDLCCLLFFTQVPDHMIRQKSTKTGVQFRDSRKFILSSECLTIDCLRVYEKYFVYSHGMLLNLSQCHRKKVTGHIPSFFISLNAQGKTGKKKNICKDQAVLYLYLHVLSFLMITKVPQQF